MNAGAGTERSAGQKRAVGGGLHMHYNWGTIGFTVSSHVAHRIIASSSKLCIWHAAGSVSAAICGTRIFGKSCFLVRLSLISHPIILGILYYHFFARIIAFRAIAYMRMSLCKAPRVRAHEVVVGSIPGAWHGAIETLVNYNNLVVWVFLKFL